MTGKEQVHAYPFITYCKLKEKNTTTNYHFILALGKRKHTLYNALYNIIIN